MDSDRRASPTAMKNARCTGRVPVLAGPMRPGRQGTARPLRIAAAWALAGAGVLLSGCDRAEVQTYRIPKEPKAAAHASAGMGHGHGRAPAMASIQGETPSGWVDQGPSGMRAARFRIPGADGEPDGDLAVIPLPAFPGGDVEVVNLWRESLGLAKIDAAELAPQAERVPVGDTSANLYDMTSEGPVQILNGKKARILAAILPRQGAVWYFKLMGSEATVERSRSGFLDYLKSVRFEDAPAVADASLAAARATGAPTPEWNIPPAWSPEAAPAMALAGFSVSDPAAGNASISVTMLAGDGGGALPNVNRWRGQLGLQPLTDQELGRESAALDLGAERALLVDIEGKDARSGRQSRMVGAIVLRSSDSWFFKMTGDQAIVEREKQAFVDFVRSVRFPNG